MSSTTKKIVGTVNLVVPAGSAKMGPPIGSILGQRGVNIASFCKEFNSITSHLDKGVPIPTYITIYSDRTYSIVTKKPTVTYFIKKALSLEKGSTKPGSISCGTISRKQCLEIAREKMSDLSSYTEEGAVSIVIGSALSMGLEVVD